MTPLALLLALPAPTSALALPEDAIFALHLRGGEELQARINDNAWLRVGARLADQAIAEAFDGMQLVSLEAWASDLESMDMFVNSDLTTAGVFVSPGAEGHFAAALSSFREMIEGEVGAGEERGGLTVFSVQDAGWDLPNGDDAAELVVVEAGGVLGLILSSDSGGAAAAATEALSGGGVGPAGLTIAREMLDEAHGLMHVDLGGFFAWAMAQDTELGELEGLYDTLFGGMGPAGIAVRFDEGSGIEGLMHVTFEEDSFIGELASSVSAYDPALLRWVPENSVGFQVMGFDMGAFVEVLLALAADMDEDVAMQIDAGLGMVTDQTGVDPIDDVLAYLDGGLVTFFTEIPDFDTVNEAEAMPDMGYIFGVEDVEAFEENLLAIAETFGVMGLVEVEELSGGNVYSMASGIDLPMVIVAGRGAFGVLMGDEAIDHGLSLIGGQSPRSVVDDEDLREVLAMGRGTAGLSYFDADLLLMILEAIEEESGGLGLSELIAAVEGTIVMTNEAEPDSMTVRMFMR